MNILDNENIAAGLRQGFGSEGAARVAFVRKQNQGVTR